MTGWVHSPGYWQGIWA